MRLSTSFPALLAAALLALGSAPAFAADTPASDASIRELLELTGAREVVDDIVSQVDGMMGGVFAETFAKQGYVPNAEQTKIIDDMRAQAVVLLRETLKWEEMEPSYIEVYRRSFSQAEVDGMVAFYKTPAGQAVVRKMPLVLQNSMQFTQQRMTQMMPKLQELQTATIEKLKVAATASP